MLDKSHRPTEVRQAAVDRIHWFFSLDPAGRRQYSEDTANNIYYEQVATHWGNWAKIFFNNKGVVAKATETCADYPQGDMSVWDWRSHSLAAAPQHNGPNPVSSAVCSTLVLAHLSVADGDGSDVVGGNFVAEVVNEGDVDRSLGASGFAHHSGALGSGEVLVAPLLEGADEDVQFAARWREVIGGTSALTWLLVGLFSHDAVFDEGR
jgi:hypothetical protein